MILDLQEGEHVIKEIRKHWFLIFIKAFGLVLFILFFIIIAYTAIYFSSDFIQFEGEAGYLFMFVLLSLILCAWIGFFSFFTTFYLDYWIITNRRVIDMDLINFFYQNVATIHLHDIEDIQMEKRGIFSSFLNFGSLAIQSAGAKREFNIDNIPNPEALRDELFRLHEKAMEEPHRVIITNPDQRTHH